VIIISSQTRKKISRSSSDHSTTIPTCLAAALGLGLWLGLVRTPGPAVVGVVLI
jgi:hypothetical protein